MIHDIHAYGKIDKDGNLVFAGWGGVKSQLRENAGLPVTIHIKPMRPVPCGKFIGYFDNVVMPVIFQELYKQGHRYNYRDAVSMVLSQCPLTNELKPDDLYKLDEETWCFFLEDVRVWAGENLHIFIEKPQIFKDDR